MRKMESTELLTNSQIELQKGEWAFENSPTTTLLDGKECVPQHYLNYHHTLASVEALVANTSFSDDYSIFVSEDQGGVYIQIGIIGKDNYLPMNANNKTKIVYGRKWRVEKKLPSAEILQTVFLAIKTAREHELREKFQVLVNGKNTTPFNNHQDYKLLCQIFSAKQAQKVAENKPTTLLADIEWADLQLALDKIHYDDASFIIKAMEKRISGYWLIELEIIAGEKTTLSELSQHQYIVLTLLPENMPNQGNTPGHKPLTKDAVYYELIQQLVQLSNRYVEENFLFEGVARFSRNHQVQSIAELAINTRQLHKNINEFEQLWRNKNIETDLSRVPNLPPQAIEETLNHYFQKTARDAFNDVN